jgi:Ca-activated chloride channel homolog
MAKNFTVALLILAFVAAGAIALIGASNNSELPPSVTVNDKPTGNDPQDPNKPGDPTATGTEEFPENTGTNDDWKYSAQMVQEESLSVTNKSTSSGFHSMGGGMGSAATGATYSAAPSANMMADSTIGLAAGGAKDTNNFRKNIENGYLPLDTDITYEGLYYNYYFDTGKAQACEKLFCPSYSKAVSKDPFSGKSDYFLTVGLNSGIKESDFDRKKLNLVVVMDISGSMGSPFDQYYYDQYGNYRTPTAEEQQEMSKTKMRVADESLVAMTKHLRADDRFGVVLFDESAYVAKPLSKVGTTDMDKIRQHIMEITEQGSTNMEAGINEGTKLFAEYKTADQNEYENRIIFITDAQPNTGGTSE